MYILYSSKNARCKFIYGVPRATAFTVSKTVWDIERDQEEITSWRMALQLLSGWLQLRSCAPSSLWSHWVKIRWSQHVQEHSTGSLPHFDRGPVLAMSNVKVFVSWLRLPSRFVASDGSLESGIDGGGLFKEFMKLGWGCWGWQVGH